MASLLPAWPGAAYAAHQSTGISWMLQQERDGADLNGKLVRGGILGDEMGLGKTIQSLGLVVNNKVRRTLIITPLAVRKQWEDAACRCDLNVYVADGASWSAKSRIRPRRPEIYLGHYDRLTNDSSLFLLFNFNRIILDEAHRIRNQRTRTFKAVIALEAEYKWCLTGTPIVNEFTDAVAYLRFIGAPVREDTRTWQPAYKPWIRKVYLARLLEECEAPAGMCIPPEPVAEVRQLDFTNEAEAKIYDAIYNNIEHQLRDAQRLRGRAYNLAMFSILLRLRQVSVSPQIYINARQKEEFGYTGPDFTIPSRKFTEIADLLRRSSVAGQQDRWIIFCQFHHEMGLMREYLRSFPHVGQILEYHGAMSLKERNEVIKQSHTASTDGKQDVFLVQLHAGGTGLNLQHYNRVIFTSPWWTAALLDQALGRVVRIGQDRIVKIYWLRLNAEDTFNIDSFIMEKADKKRLLGQTFLSMSHGRGFGALEGQEGEESDEDEFLDPEDAYPAGRGRAAAGGGAAEVVVIDDDEEDEDPK